MGSDRLRASSRRERKANEEILKQESNIDWRRVGQKGNGECKDHRKKPESTSYREGKTYRRLEPLGEGLKGIRENKVRRVEARKPH